MNLAANIGMENDPGAPNAMLPFPVRRRMKLIKKLNEMENGKLKEVMKIYKKILSHYSVQSKVGV